MPNPSKCISTAEMFFLKASISADWHTSDLVWLGQKYKYHSQVRAVTKGSLLILHPFIRDRVKFQSWTRAYIQTHSPTHQIDELIVLKSYAPVVRSPAVKSSKNLVVKYADFQHGGRLKLQQAFYLWESDVWRKNRNDFTAPLCPLILALFLLLELGLSYLWWWRFALERKVFVSELNY